MPVVVVFNILPALAATVEPRLEAVLHTGGQHILDYAKSQMGTYPPASAPGDFPAQRSGDLANDTEVADVGALSVEARWNAGHAMFVNYGTRRMAARPFAEPAVEHEKPVIQEALAAVVLP